MKYIGKKIIYNNLPGRLLYVTKFVDKKDLENKDILDIGCGFGWFANVCLKNKCKLFLGIDLSNDNNDLLKEAFKNNSKVSFKEESVLDISYKNKFDTATMWEVIEHLPHNTESKMFRNVFASLKNEGVFYLSTPFHSLLAILLDPAYWLISHRHYKTFDLVKLALNEGFYLEKIEIRGRIWELLGMLNLYIAKWVFRRPPFFKSFFDNKASHEYINGHGFTNIFLKFRKFK